MPAFVTRCGVLTYRKADGTVVRELRHPDHVFRADSLATLRDAPVTVGHPGEGQTWVSPENAHQHEVGVVRAATREGEFVSATVNVRRADAIKRIDSKDLVEVSAAYDCDIDPTPGVYNGEPYDGVQTDITYNHVALLAVGKGRAGRDVRLRADSDDALIETTERKEPKTMSTKTVRVDGLDHELPIAAASVLEKVVRERDEATKRADSAEALRDQMKADLAKAHDPKLLSERVSARVSLEREATKVLGAEKRFDGLTDREVQEEVLKVASPEFKREGRSDDAISAAFEYATTSNPNRPNHGLRLVSEGLKNGVTQRADGASVGEPTTQTTNDPDAEVRRQLDQIEKERAEMWKGKGA